MAVSQRKVRRARKAPASKPVSNPATTGRSRAEKSKAEKPPEEKAVKRLRRIAAEQQVDDPAAIDAGGAPGNTAEVSRPEGTTTDGVKPQVEQDVNVAPSQQSTFKDTKVCGDNIEALPSAGRREALRVIEALLFAAPAPLSAKKIAEHLPDGSDVGALIEELRAFYSGRGIHLVRVAGKWAFRTAEDLAYLLERHAVEQRRLSKAALETLAIIAYHQPVTRAEIEEIRGVSTSRGTLDALMETGWVRPRGRRRAPGKPNTYGTTDEFLSHFGLDTVSDLPGVSELRGAGLLDSDLPPDFGPPNATQVAAMMPDELPLEEEIDEEEGEAETVDVSDGDGHAE